jgi:hypothetical protein
MSDLGHRANIRIVPDALSPKSLASSRHMSNPSRRSFAPVCVAASMRGMRPRLTKISLLSSTTWWSPLALE